MNKKTLFQIGKIFITVLVLLVAFSSASAVCDSAAEKYYFPNGTAIACPNSNLPEKMYSEVMMLSLPLHFTFAMQDRITTSQQKVNPLACGEQLFGSGYFDPTNTGSRTNLVLVGCYLLKKDVYETLTVVRNLYDWTAEYDAIVVASDKNQTIPLNVGRNLTLHAQPDGTFAGLCEDNSLCYTDVYVPTKS